MLTLRLSVPLHWRTALTPNWRKPPQLPGQSGILVSLPEEDPKDILACSSKTFYMAAIAAQKWTPTAAKRWEENDSSPLHIADHAEWSQISLRPFQSTRETKLQSLQYKINHRISPCNVYLHQIRIKETDKCSFCNDRDTELHFFHSCEPVSRLWRQICSWFEAVQNLQLREVSPKEFLFGTPTDSQRGKMSNYILAHTKFFVMRQKLFHNGQLDLTHWLREFRDRLRIENHIAYREGKLSRFRKWSNILAALG